MEVTLGMIADEFIVEADCRQPMLKPMAGILRKKHKLVSHVGMFIKHVFYTWPDCAQEGC